MYQDFSRIFVASALRDMKTRFGRTYSSFFLSIAWPLTHLTAICTAYYMTHRIAAIGDTPGVFATTGVVPYIFCLYPARFTAFSVLQNKALLQFAIIKPLHLIVARAFLEVLSASVVFGIFSAALMVLGVEIVPFDIPQAFVVLLATVFLGIGIGVFGVTLCVFNPMIGVLTIVFSILGLYMTSGAFLPVETMSNAFREVLYYNPLYHSVSLLRAAYFDSSNCDNCEIGYVFLIGSVFFALGLASERILRGRIMI